MGSKPKRKGKQTKPADDRLKGENDGKKGENTGIQLKIHEENNM